jgi:hypothetical protein
VSRKRLRYLLIGAGIALLVWVTVEVILAGRGIPPIPVASAPIELRGGDVRANGHTVESRSWRFKYDRGELSSDGTTGTLDGIHDGIVYRKGKPYLLIDAQHVALNTATLDFTAIGAVHIEMLSDPSHRSFDTDDVAWTNDAKLLEMPHTSYLHVGGQTLKIGSVTVDFVKNQVHLTNVEGAVGAP